jgi:hypothetical protein
VPADTTFIAFDRNRAAVFEVERDAAFAAFKCRFSDLSINVTGSRDDVGARAGPVTVLVNDSRALFEQCTFSNTSVEAGHAALPVAMEAPPPALHLYARPPMNASLVNATGFELQQLVSEDPPKDGKGALFLQASAFQGIEDVRSSLPAFEMWVTAPAYALPTDRPGGSPSRCRRCRPLAATVQYSSACPAGVPAGSA